MRVEVLVLGRQERPDHDLRDGIDRHEDPPLPRVFRDQRTIVGMYPGHHRRLVFRQAFITRQILRGVPHDVARRPEDSDHHEHAGRERESQKAQEKTLLATFLTTLARLARRRQNRRSHDQRLPINVSIDGAPARPSSAGHPSRAMAGRRSNAPATGAMQTTRYGQPAQTARTRPPIWPRKPSPCVFQYRFASCLTSAHPGYRSLKFLAEIVRNPLRTDCVIA